MGETVVFPVHPRTQKLLKTYNLYDRLTEDIRLIEPQGYFEFLKLMDHSKKILTDSGGIQKESYMLKVPCITLMDTSPWVETLAEGWNILAGNDTKKIIELARNFKPDHQYSYIFGQGACEKIAHIIGDT
jgi:UDP-N-acetylglucosamine 2-epimerase